MKSTQYRAILVLGALFFDLANAKMIGNLESIDDSNKAIGWACDNNDSGQAVQVDFYATGENGNGGFIGSTHANLPSEEKVNTACAGGKAHRFSYQFSQTERSKLGPGPSTIRAVAHTGAKHVPLPLLAPVLKQFPAQLLPGMPVLQVEGSYKTLVYAPYFTKNCYVTNLDTDRNLADPAKYPFAAAIKGDNCHKGVNPGNIWHHAWHMTALSEVPFTHPETKKIASSQHMPDPQFPWPPINFSLKPDAEPFALAGDGSNHLYHEGQIAHDSGKKVLDYHFKPHPDNAGQYILSLSLDKASAIPAGQEDRYLPKFTGAFFNSPLQAKQPNLLKSNVFARFKVALKAVDQNPSKYPFNPSGAVQQKSGNLSLNRLTLGMTVQGSGISWFPEVDLWRTSNFDLCTQGNAPDNWPEGTVCDPDKVWDQRAKWGQAGHGGELAYYDGSHFADAIGKSLPALTASKDAPAVFFLLPLSQMFRAMPKGFQPRPDSNDGVLQGVYIGVEIYGAGRIWFELSEYDVFEFTATP